MSVAYKTIEVIVKPNGEATIETKGFPGPECRDATRSLELALGRRTSERLTAEFYQSQSIQQSQSQTH